MSADLALRASDHHVGGSRSAAALIGLGGVCGLAWAAGLRGFMAQLAGSDSTVGWYGTFVQILLPGTLIGLSLGWAEHIRRTGGRRGWRWLALSPLLFPIAVFVSPDVIHSVMAGEPLLGGGIGGGAIALPLFGMAGGFALSGRGHRWARVALGAIALAPIPSWALTAQGFGSDFRLTTPRGAWVAIFFWSFMAVFCLACRIPHLPVAASGALTPNRAVEPSSSGV